jgi:hypothetical protein
MSIRCWIDPHTEANVVTLRGANREQADEVLFFAHEHFPNDLFVTNGQRSLFAEDPEIIIYHFDKSGGEVELMSHDLTHEQLLDLIPESVREKARA